MIYTPSPELIAVHWLTELSLPLVSGVSTTVPPIAKWQAPCWIQATSLGGRGDSYDPTRAVMVRTDIWGLPLKQGETNSVAELIADACHSGAGMVAEIEVRPKMWPVHLAEVTVWQQPRPLREDPFPSSKKDGAAPTQRARTTMTLSLIYSVRKPLGQVA